MEGGRGGGVREVGEGVGIRKGSGKGGTEKLARALERKREWKGKLGKENWWVGELGRAVG